MHSIAGKRLAAFFFLCLLTVFSSAAAFAGDNNEWRPVSSEELAMKTPKVEADADAEAIFWEIRIDDSSSDGFTRSNYVRVKIFTERGREKYSKFDIPFTKGLKIKDLSARVIRPDGTSVEVKKEDIFERDIVKTSGVKIKAKSFAVPNIEPGVIVEYRYKEVVGNNATAKGSRLSFQRDIPVQKLSYYYKPYSDRAPEYQSYNFNDTKFVKDEKKFYVATRTNIPAFKEEAMMPPEDQVMPWMRLQGVRVNFSSTGTDIISVTIKDPNNPSQFWGTVGKELSGLTKLMKKDKEISRVAAEATAGASTPDEKLRKLYEFCQTQIRNTTFDTSLTDEQREKMSDTKSVTDALKSKTAPSAFVDLLFGAMAQSLGFETRIAFTGDRSQIFFTPEMTNESFIHPAAIALKVGDKWQYFNPGTPFLPYGSLAWYEENVWALLVGENNIAWEKTPLTGHDKSVAKRTGKFNLLEDGTLEGTVRVEYNGQSSVVRKMDAMDDSANKQEENLKDEIKKRASAAEVSGISFENAREAQKPFAYSYKVRIPNYAQRTGKRLFLQPGFFEYGEEPVFSAANRKYEIYFHYPWAEHDEVEITLPKGFALDNGDTPAPIADPQKIGVLNIRIGTDKDETVLIYRRDFHFGGDNALVFPASSYQPLKNMFDAFHKADTHTVTLKQK